MENMTSRAVAADDATQSFRRVLARVVDGEEITITEQGVPVARIIPIRAAISIENRRSAIRRMDEIASRCRLDGLRIRDLINEGRR